jgi:hypothetical protein
MDADEKLKHDAALLLLNTLARADRFPLDVFVSWLRGEFPHRREAHNGVHVAILGGLKTVPPARRPVVRLALARTTAQAIREITQPKSASFSEQSAHEQLYRLAGGLHVPRELHEAVYLAVMRGMPTGYEWFGPARALLEAAIVNQCSGSLHEFWLDLLKDPDRHLHPGADALPRHTTNWYANWSNAWQGICCMTLQRGTDGKLTVPAWDTISDALPIVAGHIQREVSELRDSKQRPAFSQRYESAVGELYKAWDGIMAPKTIRARVDECYNPQWRM